MGHPVYIYIYIRVASLFTPSHGTVHDRNTSPAPNAPRYVTNHTLQTDFNIPYVSDVTHKRINKTSQQTVSPSQPTTTATTANCKHKETKTMLASRLARHLRWHRWVNTLPRHSNTWYWGVMCVIVTLAYRVYSDC